MYNTQKVLFCTRMRRSQYFISSGQAVVSMKDRKRKEKQYFKLTLRNTVATLAIPQALDKNRSFRFPFHKGSYVHFYLVHLKKQKTSHTSQ